MDLRFHFAAPQAATLLGLSLALAACRAAEPSTAAIVVTGQADGAPAGCSVQEVAQHLLDFADAVNGGDPQPVSEFFSDVAPFAWYSAPDGDPKTGGHIAVYSVKELPAYFERRQTQHEQLYFERIQVNGWEPRRGLVHFEFTVRRQANDLNQGVAREVIGKGAFHCQTQSFVAISVGEA